MGGRGATLTPHEYYTHFSIVRVSIILMGGSRCTRECRGVSGNSGAAPGTFWEPKTKIIVMYHYMFSGGELSTIIDTRFGCVFLFSLVLMYLFRV